MAHASVAVLYRWDHRLIQGAGAREPCMGPERIRHIRACG